MCSGSISLLPADKAGSNIIIVCKQIYIHVFLLCIVIYKFWKVFFFVEFFQKLYSISNANFTCAKHV